MPHGLAWPYGPAISLRMYVPPRVRSLRSTSLDWWSCWNVSLVDQCMGQRYGATLASEDLGERAAVANPAGNAEGAISTAPAQETPPLKRASDQEQLLNT